MLRSLFASQLRLFAFGLAYSSSAWQIVLAVGLKQTANVESPLIYVNVFCMHQSSDPKVQSHAAQIVLVCIGFGPCVGKRDILPW